VHTTLIIVASTLPIFFLGGVAGSFSSLVRLRDGDPGLDDRRAHGHAFARPDLAMESGATGALMSLMWRKAAGDVLPSHLESVGPDQKTMRLAARNPT